MLIFKTTSLKTVLALQTNLKNVTFDGTLYNVNFNHPQWEGVTLKGKVTKFSCKNGTIKKLTLDGEFDGELWEHIKYRLDSYSFQHERTDFCCIVPDFDYSYYDSHFDREEDEESIIVGIHLDMIDLANPCGYDIVIWDNGISDDIGKLQSHEYFGKYVKLPFKKFVVYK